MSRILLDQNVPAGLRRFLAGHEVRTAAEQGWSDLGNGELLDAAEREGFAVMVTADRNMRHQQDLGARKLAFVVLPTNRWSLVREHGERVARAVGECRPGLCIEVDFGPVRHPRGSEP